MKAFLPLDCFFVIRHANSASDPALLQFGIRVVLPLAESKPCNEQLALSLGSTGFVAECAFCQADSTVTGL